MAEIVSDVLASIEAHNIQWVRFVWCDNTSFVPKIFSERTGSSAHLHIGFWHNSKNLISDPAQPTTLSSKALAFVAGILHHLPALVAITAPSPNSYRRIVPRFWSGAYSCWGYGNREAAVRVPQPPAGRAITNIELKAIDAASNPYLALGAVIVAGLDGIENDPDQILPVQWHARFASVHRILRVEFLAENLVNECAAWAEFAEAFRSTLRTLHLCPPFSFASVGTEDYWADQL